VSATSMVMTMSKMHSTCDCICQGSLKVQLTDGIVHPRITGTADCWLFHTSELPYAKAKSRIQFFRNSLLPHDDWPA
jgi:hypothetical protein